MPQLVPIRAAATDLCVPTTMQRIVPRDRNVPSIASNGSLNRVPPGIRSFTPPGSFCRRALATTLPCRLPKHPPQAVNRRSPRIAVQRSADLNFPRGVDFMAGLWAPWASLRAPTGCRSARAGALRVLSCRRSGHSRVVLRPMNDMASRQPAWTGSAQGPPVPPTPAPAQFPAPRSRGGTYRPVRSAGAVELCRFRESRFACSRRMLRGRKGVTHCGTVEPSVMPSGARDPPGGVKSGAPARVQ